MNCCVRHLFFFDLWRRLNRGWLAAERMAQTSGDKAWLGRELGSLGGHTAVARDCQPSHSPAQATVRPTPTAQQRSHPSPCWPATRLQPQPHRSACQPQRQQQQQNCQRRNWHSEQHCFIRRRELARPIRRPLQRRLWQPHRPLIPLPMRSTGQPFKQTITCGIVKCASSVVTAATAALTDAVAPLTFEFVPTVVTD